MLKIYGSRMCPDCVECLADLGRAGVPYEYLDFSENLRNLKEFLALRDGSSEFDDVRAHGSIGIPCLLRDDGSITLDWAEFMK